jgi:hypothetical protein
MPPSDLQKPHLTFGHISPETGFDHRLLHHALSVESFEEAYYAKAKTHKIHQTMVTTR